MPHADLVVRKQYHRAYYVRHRVAQLAAANRRFQEHHEKILKYKRNYWQRHAKRLKARRQRLRRELRLRLLRIYGRGKIQCLCCGEREEMFLSIDHKNNQGAAHRRKIGRDNLHRWLEKHKYPKGYQTMCMNCNWGKHRNGGICPHVAR